MVVACICHHDFLRLVSLHRSLFLKTNWILNNKVLHKDRADSLKCTFQLRVEMAFHSFPYQVNQQKLKNFQAFTSNQVGNVLPAETLGRCRLFSPCKSFVFPLKSAGHAEESRSRGSRVPNRFTKLYGTISWKWFNTFGITGIVCLKMKLLTLFTRSRVVANFQWTTKKWIL